MKKHINKLTPGYNLLWESTRMILPEHREAILARKERLKRRSRPKLDHQLLERIQHIIDVSMKTKCEVRFEVFGEMESVWIEGYVVRTDPYQGRILIQTKDRDIWLKTSDILFAEC